LEKAGGRALVEYKYDGERIQIHKDDETVSLYSRRHEEISLQYPDVVKYVLKNIDASECVLEAECVAVDPKTDKLRPFQELMRRRRKTDIEEMTKEVPVALFFFDILYLDGREVTNLPMLERRNLLEKIVRTTDRVSLSVGEVIGDPEQLDAVFMEAIDLGLEGVIAKAVHENSIYQAGSRSWLWIKLKASYKEGLTDSIDVVIVGAMHGRGKRKGVYGAILASVYDVESDTYPTVCKIGTGFTDEMLDEFKKRLDEYQIESKGSKIISDLDADVWFEPVKVIEVLGDEITVSPTHPAGRGIIGEGGLAIRFPRFTGRWREDKGPTQATTVDELVDMFERQRVRI
jgi:DNA ligase-1